MAVTLRPFRDYDEKDVINLYAFEGTIPVNRGHIVAIDGNAGWQTSQELEMLGNLGKDYNNTVSTRYGVTARVSLAGTSDVPLGMLLYDCKETDENGELLKFHPRKAAEMEVALSGQTVPVVSKGMFLYSGSTLASDDPNAGVKIYVGAAGVLTTGTAGALAGKTLGSKDSDGVILIKLEL
jgi:hypothetical protein